MATVSLTGNAIYVKSVTSAESSYRTYTVNEMDSKLGKLTNETGETRIIRFTNFMQQSATGKDLCTVEYIKNGAWITVMNDAREGDQVYVGNI